MGRVNISLDDELHKKLKVACALLSVTLEHYINESISEKLKRDKHVK